MVRPCGKDLRATDVIDVAVREDHGGDGLIGELGNAVHDLLSRICGRIHDDDAVLADDEAGVAAATRVDEVDVVLDLLYGDGRAALGVSARGEGECGEDRDPCCDWGEAKSEIAMRFHVRSFARCLTMLNCECNAFVNAARSPVARERREVMNGNAVDDIDAIGVNSWTCRLRRRLCRGALVLPCSMRRRRRRNLPAASSASPAYRRAA